MRTTQKDIARELGISLVTVNRALNNSGYVSKELKKRIFEYVKDASYVPHRASQALVRNRARNIAVFSSSLPDYFWNDIRKGIDAASEQVIPFNYSIRYHMIPESDTDAYLRTLKHEIRNGLEAAAIVNQRLYDMQSIMSLLDAERVPYVTFNVDAPESRRLGYIGSDYHAGGRLAADFIGKALLVSRGGTVLAISSMEDGDRFSSRPDINGERLDGFLSTMKEWYPAVTCEVAYITTILKPGLVDSQIEDILRDREGRVDAVYMIPAFNTVFLEALEKLSYRNAITVLHDLDSSAVHHLETRLLSGVIDQHPILQGYYTIKTLEHILESKNRAGMKDVEIAHSLVLAENRNLYRNHYTLAELME